MKEKNSKSWPLSRIFFKAVMDATSTSSSQSDSENDRCTVVEQQVNANNVTNIVPPSIQTNSNDQLLHDKRPPSTSRQLSPVVNRTPNDDSLSRMSTVSAFTSSKASSVTSPNNKPYHYPVSYFKILTEDATDRYTEACNFFYETSSYSLKFEFHIKIMKDLFKELANPPPNLAAEDYANVSRLRRRLRRLQLNLVGRRNLLLGYGSGYATIDDKLKRLKISPSGADSFVQAADEARKSRQRQCEMVALIHKIADLRLKEERYKQRRLEAEAELGQYFGKMVVPSDGDSEQMSEASNSAYEAASEGSGTVRNEVESSSTSQSGDNLTSDFSEGSGTVRNAVESSSTSQSGDNLTSDPYCILWLSSSSQTKQLSSTNQKISLIPLKPSSCCTFCNELHWSHLCLKMSTLEERQRYYRKHGLCPICGTSHRGDCATGERPCKWPHCRARNSHHSALCPNIEYPITAEVVQAYERRINDLNRIHNRSKVSEENLFQTRKRSLTSISEWVKSVDDIAPKSSISV